MDCALVWVGNVPKWKLEAAMQKVYIGRTISGQRGLFTGNFLACPLREDEDAAEKARRMGFELVPSPHVEPHEGYCPHCDEQR